MNDSAIRTGVLGATGYTGRELLKLLAGHRRAEIVLATSQSEAGESLRGVCRAAPELPLVPVEEADLASCDVVFSCLPHGDSGRWARSARRAGARVVDLSADLRVGSSDGGLEGAVYGLPELNRDGLRGASLVANPGCYPTAALIALTPLLRRGMIAGPVIINAASGVTGAGRTAKRELLFAEVAEDFRAYAVGNVHRHLAEMRDQVEKQASAAAPELVFTPHLLPIRRGILETIYVPLRDAPGSDPLAPWVEDFGGEPFVTLLRDRPASLVDVVGTNQVAISVAPVRDVKSPLLIITAAIDNLTKGAAGQAVQNMNLMMGLCEREGLV
jgi:N-acetyl-gamma-glutamyl-phosphate reductase